MDPFYLCVGTFDSSVIYVLSFHLGGNGESSLSIVSESVAPGPHSWLSLNEDGSKLYATNWTDPPGLASYSISRVDQVPSVSLINTVQTASRSGYCCNSAKAVYSAGGASGEVFSIEPATGGFAKMVQQLEFVDPKLQVDDGNVLDFGGLRNGAHSADLSPDGEVLYVADIGRNCVFVCSVNQDDGQLTLTDKSISPGATDGPRHVTPHPDGRYVYCLQEHSSMVDIFELVDSRLEWRQGVKIIPSELSPTLFWADEVRVSPSRNFLFASTRGLVHSTKGWLAAFPLSTSGLLSPEAHLAFWETPTSGGWANAIQPYSKTVGIEGVECDLLALTDEEQGLVLIIKFDGARFTELARLKLPTGKAATAVWLTA